MCVVVSLSLSSSRLLFIAPSSPTSPSDEIARMSVEEIRQRIKLVDNEVRRSVLFSP